VGERKDQVFRPDGEMKSIDTGDPCKKHEAVTVVEIIEVF